MAAEFDIVIRGGDIYDGSGSSARTGDVAVRDGVIAAVGHFTGSGREEIDARGRLVTPGFVDIHTHYDGQATWAHRFQPSTQHGVTTVVMGNCGVGFAPCRATDRELMVRLMEGVEDIPGAILSEGVPWAWESFPEYLDFLAGRQYDADVATQVPHSAVRINVMGERGANREPASRDDMERMARIVGDGVRAGALGFSTSRLTTHRRRDGSLAPSITAGEEELRAIVMALREAGSGTIQFADDFSDTEAGYATEFEMWKRLGRLSGRPISYNLVQSHRASGRWEHLLAMTRKANEEGVVMRPQVCGRPIGIFLGLHLSAHPFMHCPTYKAFADLPHAKRVERMRGSEVRRKLLAEEAEGVSPEWKALLTNADDMVQFADPVDYFPPAERKLSVIAASLGITARELAYEVLLSGDGTGILHHPVNNFLDSKPTVVRQMLEHPDAIVGLGDGGAHVGMICDASLPTHLLSFWARDAQAMDQFELGWAVKQLTRRPAEVVGMLDRGLLAPGYKADINIIDHAKLSLAAPHPMNDLPGGGMRLGQEAKGYDCTILSGVVTYRESKPTGALPGRLVRGAQGARG